jgi:hypothetical protein
VVLGDGCGGATAVTTAVGNESSSSSPAGFLSFTRTRRRNPSSVGVTVYVADVASLMSLQSSGLSALQRRHLYSIVVGGSPAASNADRSVSPTAAFPWMLTEVSTGRVSAAAEPVTASAPATAPTTAPSRSRFLILGPFPRVFPFGDCRARTVQAASA